jgi:hypothetical protein
MRQKRLEYWTGSLELVLRDHVPRVCEDVIRKGDIPLMSSYLWIEDCGKILIVGGCELSFLQKVIDEYFRTAPTFMTSSLIADEGPVVDWLRLLLRARGSHLVALLYTLLKWAGDPVYREWEAFQMLSACLPRIDWSKSVPDIVSAFEKITMEEKGDRFKILIQCVLRGILLIQDLPMEECLWRFYPWIVAYARSLGYDAGILPCMVLTLKGIEMMHGRQDGRQILITGISPNLAYFYIPMIWMGVLWNVTGEEGAEACHSPLFTKGSYWTPDARKEIILRVLKAEKDGWAEYLKYISLPTDQNRYILLNGFAEGYKDEFWDVVSEDGFTCHFDHDAQKVTVGLIANGS